MSQRIANAKVVVEVFIPEWFYDKPRLFGWISAVATAVAIQPLVYERLPRQWYGRPIYRPYPNA